MEILIKPLKKSTRELFRAIEEAIKTGSYFFTEHADLRSKTRRNVTDLEVLKVLEGNDKRGMPIITVINLDEN